MNSQQQQGRADLQASILASIFANFSTTASAFCFGKKENLHLWTPRPRLYLMPWVTASGATFKHIYTTGPHVTVMKESRWAPVRQLSRACHRGSIATRQIPRSWWPWPAGEWQRISLPWKAGRGMLCTIAWVPVMRMRAEKMKAEETKKEFWTIRAARVFNARNETECESEENFPRCR